MTAGLLLLVCILQAPASAAEAVRLVESPVESVGPVDVARSWNSFEVREISSPRGPIVVGDSSGARSAARVDTFIFGDGTWIWRDTYRLHKSGRVEELSPNGRNGILVRFQAAESYLWGEASSDQQEVRLVRYKTLRVEAPAGAASLYLDGGSQPRHAATRQGRLEFHLVPLRQAIVCFDKSLICSEAPPAAVTFSARSETEPSFQRILSFEGERTAVVRIPSLSPLRPRVRAATLTRAGEWALLTTDQTDLAGAVIDLESRDCASERVTPALLPTPPDFYVVPRCIREGVRVRATLDHDFLRVEPEAQLLVFAADDASRLIPLGVSTMKDGEFPLPSVAPGTYQLKLVSAAASNRILEAPLAAGESTVVRFPTGPLVSGRLQRIAGGATDEPPSVTIIRRGEIARAKAENPDAADVGDWIRHGALDDSGRFAIAVNLPGTYRLRARWGAGVATREFTMKQPPADLELGTIQIPRAATVRGRVIGCIEGNVRFTPLPDLTRPLEIEFAEARAVAIDDTSRYFAEGLAAGQWIVGVKCSAGNAAPQLVTIADGEEKILDLAVAAP